MDAYIGGLEKRAWQPGKRVDRIASVASFFVSRVDYRRRQAARAEDRRDAAADQQAQLRAACRQGRDRQRQARLCGLPREVRRRALRGARTRRRPAAAAALGQHVDQEPRLPRRLLRRGAGRTRHRRHHAARHASSPTRITASPSPGSTTASTRRAAVLQRSPTPASAWTPSPRSSRPTASRRSPSRSTR